MLADVVANVGVSVGGTDYSPDVRDYHSLWLMFCQFNQQTNQHGKQHLPMFNRVLAHLRTHNITPLTINGKILWRSTFLTTILFGTTFSLRPEEAIMKIWLKLVFNQFKFPFFLRNIRPSLHWYDTKENEKHPCTYKLNNICQHEYMHTYIFTYLASYMHACIHKNLYTYTKNIYVYTHVHVEIHT